VLDLFEPNNRQPLQEGYDNMISWLLRGFEGPIPSTSRALFIKTAYLVIPCYTALATGITFCIGSGAKCEVGCRLGPVSLTIG